MKMLLFFLVFVLNSVWAEKPPLVSRETKQDPQAPDQRRAALRSALNSYRERLTPSAGPQADDRVTDRHLTEQERIFLRKQLREQALQRRLEAASGRP